MDSQAVSTSSTLNDSSTMVDLLTWAPSTSYQKPSLKVSSVLNKNKKVHGASKMIDGQEDTCWNSEGIQSNSSQTLSEGVHKVDPQTVTINFHRDVQIDSLEIMFQGGFVGLEIDVEYEEMGDTTNLIEETNLGTTNDSTKGNLKNSSKKIHKIEPEDNNELQRFPLAIQSTSKIKLYINKFSDFYGRVTIYHLKVLGNSI